MASARDDTELEAFLDALKERRGLDFTGYRRATLGRRMGRRLQLVGVTSLADYLERLESDPEEFVQLLNTLLINVTAFFRDASAWQYLAEAALPAILAHKGGQGGVRVWSAGTASGEEAYSLAILFAEALGLPGAQARVRIYATDIDETALEEARHAVYPPPALEAVPEHLRARYFLRAGAEHAVDPGLRQLVVFGRHNLLTDSPISKLDLIVCRNTLMYFQTPAQRQVLSGFHFALQEEGYLFLGKAEVPTTYPPLFVPAHVRHRVFRKVPVTIAQERGQPLALGGGALSPADLAEATRLRAAAAEAGIVPELVVDLRGLLVEANAAARSVLSIAPEAVGRPLQVLNLASGPVELRPRIAQALSLQRALHERGVELCTASGETRAFDIDILPLFDATSRLLGVSVVFAELARHREMQEALERAQRELRSVVEAHQSTDEELQATSEELQSSAEELATMNEELQAANDELQATNELLRRSTELLTSSNLFLTAVLASVTVAVIAVNAQLVVTAWNRGAEQLWGLRAEEAEGEPLLELGTGPSLDALRDPLLRVVAGESAREEVVLDAVDGRGPRFRCRALLSPLVHARQRPEGAVVLVEESEVGRRRGF